MIQGSETKNVCKSVTRIDHIHDTHHLCTLLRTDGIKAMSRGFPGGKLPARVLGLIFARYVPLASQSPYPIIVYSVANYRPHLSHFWANM